MYNTDEPYNSPPHSNGDVIGTYGPSGYLTLGGTCYYGAVVRYNSGDIVPAGGCAGGGGDVYILVSGAGTVRRGAAPDYHQCGPTHSDHCERFEDQSLSVAIEPVRASLRLTASPSTVDSTNTNDKVHFSATVTPSTEQGNAIPFGINSWVFSPDGGGSTVSIWGAAQSFDWHPSKSGVMCVTANVNSSTQQRCQHVNVVHCPVSDSLLNDPAMRDSMAAYLTDGMNDPDLYERKAVRFHDVLTGQIRYVRAPTQPIDRCRIAWSVPSHSSTEVIDAVIHTHNYFPDSAVVCSDTSGPGTYDPSIRGGGSISDWKAVRQMALDFGYPIPSYAIDPVAIYRFDPSTPEGEEEANRHEWRKSGAGCYTNLN